MENKLIKLAEFTNKLGLGKYLLGIKSGAMITIHFEDLSIKHAMEIMIAGFHQCIKLDIEKNPQYSEARKQIYADLALGFDKLVKDANARFEKIPK